MGLIAIFLIPLVLFFWFAFMFTLYTVPMAILCLCKYQFIRASLWISTGIYMLLWWDGRYPAWETGLPIYIMLTGAGMIGATWKFLREQRTLQRVPPFGAMPEVTGNIVPFIKATREERERVMVIQGHRCANPYCNTDLRQSVPHWDHIVPRSQGGTDSVHNMQWLCDTCNLNKKDMHWLEFLYRYATEMGMDPNKNEKPWQNWVLTRTKNGLQCQG